MAPGAAGVPGQALPDPATREPRLGVGHAAEVDQLPGAGADPDHHRGDGREERGDGWEIAEGWQPMFYLPERAGEVWGDSLAAGRATRDPALGDLDVVAGAPLAVTEDEHAAAGLLDAIRPVLALYVGGMGARGRNFYHDLACRYGFGAQAEVIQDRYLAGDHDAAAAAVPDELVRRSSLIGPAGYVRERLEVLRASGVTTLSVTPMAGSAAERVRLIEWIREHT
ncbi:MAG: LLM class flavin-dependent oxidoreductase [Pseudonocardiaceae bacterium]